MIDLSNYIQDHRFMLEVNRGLRYRILHTIETDEYGEQYYNLQCQTNNKVYRPIPRYIEDWDKFMTDGYIRGTRFRFLK